MAKKISGMKRMLGLLFKEVAEQIDEEQVAKLMDAYRSGERNIVFVIGENSRGKGYRTAFSAFTVDHSDWKLYAEPQEPIKVQVPLDGNIN